MYHLYYAGMGADQSTEQIGLALSSDGRTFQRWNSSGLIVARDPGVAWKALRVCNPTVVAHGGEWLMFYQGVGRHAATGLTTHTIAIARSADAKAWVCDAEPILSFDGVKSVVGELAAAEAGGVIEPAVVADGRGLTMYFVAYQGSYQVGTLLCRATSRDAVQWTVDPAWTFSGRQFGNYRLHYPQVVDSVIWFSLIDRDNQAAAILTGSPTAGGAWADVYQVLPETGGAVRIGPREIIPVAPGGRPLRGAPRLNQLLNRVIHDGRHYLGYSHPHVLATGGHRRLYYHAYHQAAARVIWMDIGSCELDANGRVASHQVGLSPAADPLAWDSFFVADPFVITQ